jgi:hypothetical protein
MKSWLLGVPLAAGVLVAAVQSEPKVLSDSDLKQMIIGLGFEVTEGKGSADRPFYSFVAATEPFKVPTNAELSASGKYIWFSASMGKITDTKPWLELLRQNASIQPSHFYVTKADTLKIAIAVDNRSVAPTSLKMVIEKLVKDVGDSASIWQKP